MLSRVWDRLVLWWWLDHLVVGSIVVFLALKVAPGSGLDALGRLNLADRRNVYTDLQEAPCSRTSPSRAEI